MFRLPSCTVGIRCLGLMRLIKVGWKFRTRLPDWLVRAYQGLSRSDNYPSKCGKASAFHSKVILPFRQSCIRASGFVLIPSNTFKFCLKFAVIRGLPRVTTFEVGVNTTVIPHRNTVFLPCPALSELKAGVFLYYSTEESNI